MTSDLDFLESESIEILREVSQSGKKTTLLYSVGKDSSVLLHLCMKAFAPGLIPFPVLHIDTGFKFPEMYEFRDQRARDLGFELIVERNQSPAALEANPFTIGTQACCGLLKTQALLQALAKHEFEIAIGGARRDEEKSRAKERIVSVRNQQGGWNPRQQRPEFAAAYNLRTAPGQSLRVFPLANWREIDVWRYIERERISVVPLYFAALRWALVRGDSIHPIVGEPQPMSHAQPRKSLHAQEAYPVRPTRVGEWPQKLEYRFRSLGCVPCTGAVRSSARSVSEIIEEMQTTRTSERAHRAIDHDESSSMEKKKREGYF
jgi:sulfate adenylyltransferase subunit 2